MKSKEEKLKEVLVGKTISDVSVSNGHGEVLRLTLTNGSDTKTKIAICTLKGTMDFLPNKHSSESLAIYEGDVLIKDEK